MRRPTSFIMRWYLPLRTQAGGKKCTRNNGVDVKTLLWNTIKALRHIPEIGLLSLGSQGRYFLNSRPKMWKPKEVHKVSLLVQGGEGLVLGSTEVNPDFYSAQWANCRKASLTDHWCMIRELIPFNPLPARCDAPGWDKRSLGSVMSPCPGTGSTEPSGGRPAGQDPYLSAQLSSLDYSTSGEAKGWQ